MNDEVKQNIINYLTSAGMDSFRNAGLEGNERYQVNVYFGSDPPLRWIQQGSDNYVRPEVGWHVVLPYNNNRNLEEIASNNQTYSAFSFINMGINRPNGELSRSDEGELMQPDGPEQDIDIPDYTRDVTRFNTTNELHTQPYDFTAQRISNIFGPGFGFKE
jgi:hypothetical protein